MIKTLEQVEVELDQKIPRDVVSLRDGGGGRKLSYLEGHYVIDRLNKVFGHLNWAKEIVDVREVKNETPRGTFPAYLVKVRLTVFVEGRATIKEGYGYGADKSSQNAHELAIKEAVTDALKVAAKDLGMSMGLALYDKTQENVEDEPVVSAPRGGTGGSMHSVGPVITLLKIPHDTLNSPEYSIVDNKEPLKEAIQKTAKVLDALKKLSLADFKAMIKEDFGASIVADLTIEEMKGLLPKLQAMVK